MGLAAAGAVIAAVPMQRFMAEAPPHAACDVEALRQEGATDASIRFMALILYRVMRQRLKLAGSNLSTQAALSELRSIHRHSVSIDSGAPILGVSTVQPRQAESSAAFNIKKPSIDSQLPLL